MRLDRFLWFCVILAILLLCGYELAHCQIVPASEMRLTAGTPYTVPGRYQIMINSATGRITCTTPTGTDCSPTAGSIAWGAITDVPSTFPPSAHTHSAADINAGILSPLYGGTGFNGAPADIILVGNGTTYDQRSLCTGYVKYSLTTHLLTCDAGTGGSFTGGTLSTKLTLAPSTLTGAGLNLGAGSVTPTSGLTTGDLWPDATWELNWWDGANQRTAERRDHKGQPNGYAGLDGAGLVPVGNLPAGSTGVNVTGNAQQYAGFCTGTASSSTTVVIPPFGTANASSCSSTTNTNELPMSWSGTLRNLQVKAGTAGRLSTSGVVTLYKNGVATGITCTIGTGTICSDVTHTSTVNVGDTVGVRMTTQSTETLANVRVTFEDYGGGTGFNYRGTWTASTIYNPYDIVSYNGTTYERSGPTFTSAGTFNAANWNVWAAGATGGIPIGGTTGQVLAKNSATDYDVGWVTGGGGGGSGTVTSVALTAPAQFTVGGSPVTTSGTLALTWATQAANIVFAGPTSGGAATPGFRALVAADIPTLNQSTTGNAATATALAADGTDCSVGNYARGVDASGNATGCTVAGGGGTVTSFSAGNLSPLFTTSVATATTTPALTFTLSNATAHTFYGNNTGSTGAPAFVAITAADVPTLNQNTTGTAAALAANGTNCTANQFNKGVDASGNAESCAALVSGDIPNNAANTSGTSANVTGTVAIGNGGTGQTTKTPAFNALSPLTTLGDVIYHDGTNSVRLAGNTVATRKFLRQLGTGAVSAAPAWDTLLAADIPTLNQSTTGTAANVTGIVAEANGGTGAANTTGAAGHYLRSNGTHYVDNTIQAADVPTLNQATTANAGTATALAANGTNCSAGSVGAGVDASGNEEGCTATVNPTAHNLLGSTAHGDTTTATVSRGALITGQTATPKWQLLAAGSASQCLQMDASGVDIIWGACATGGSGSPGGADTQVQFNDAGVFGGDTGFVWDKTNDILTVGPAVTNYQNWAWATQSATRTVTWPDSVGPGHPRMDASGNVSYVNESFIKGACVIDGIKNSTLADAITCAGSAGLIWVPPSAALLSVPSNATIPAGVTLHVDQGAQLNPQNAVTLTINGPIDAGEYQIFSYTGTGTVALGYGIESLRALWFPGADILAQIQNACNAAPAAPSSTTIMVDAYSGGGCYTATTQAKLTTVQKAVILQGNSSNVGNGQGGTCVDFTPTITGSAFAISAISVSGTTITVTCTLTCTTGWTAGGASATIVTVRGVTIPDYDGVFPVVSITSGTRFTVNANIGAPAASSGGNVAQAPVALEIDTTGSGGGGYSSGSGLRDIFINNNACETNNGCGSYAVGLMVGRINGGMHAARLSNTKITGFGTGFSKVDGPNCIVGWGMVWDNFSFAWNNVGAHFGCVSGNENDTFVAGRFAVNGYGIQAHGFGVEISMYGGSMDSNGTCGVRLAPGAILHTSDVHWENYGNTTSHYTCAAGISSNSVLDIVGGIAYDDVTTGTTDNWFTAGLISTKGVQIQSNGRTLSGGQVFTANTAGDIDAILMNSNIGITSLAFGSVFNIKGISATTAPQRFVSTPALGIYETAASACITEVGRTWLCSDSTAHELRSSNNNGSYLRVPQVIASGTATMTTAAIATVACGTTVTVAATGVLTTDAIIHSFNAAVTAANAGKLILSSWPTAGNVNFNYCNPTAASVTPTAMTLNWRVVR